MSHRILLLASACLATASLAAGARAQTQLAEFALEGPLGKVGDRVGVAGDVDGDGVNDLLVAGDLGVYTWSGATHEILSFHGIVFGGQGDRVLAVDGYGDADGDGQADFVVATEDTGVTAYSRQGGGILWQEPGSPVGSIGWRMGVLNDVDGDGVRDLVFGEPDADPNGLNSAGSIHVLSGASGALVQRMDGTVAQQQYGRAIAAFADADGDGKDDVLVGDKKFTLHGDNVGRVQVLSSVTGAVIMQFVGPEVTPNFAIEVADLGDLDGDGRHDPGAISVSDGSGAYAAAWDADGKTQLWATSVFFTFLMRSMGDGNGDGVPELVVASPGYLGFSGGGSVLDGATGAVLAPLAGFQPGSFLGIAAPGDLTGDGLPEILVANAFSAFTNQEPYADVRSIPSGTILFALINEPTGTGLGRVAGFVGDFDGDGASDIGLGSSTTLAVFSRATGETLLEAPLPQGFFIFASGPTALAAPGDLDGDDVPDVVLGDALYVTSGLVPTGRLMVVSGADGHLIANMSGETPNSSFGAGLAVVPDADGDGVNDLWISASTKTLNGVSEQGQLQLRSGATLAVLDSVDGPAQALGRFGSSLVGGEDMNGDGVPELAVGSWVEQPGQLDAGTLYVLDGATGATLHAFTGGLNAQQTLGAIVGDSNGDEVPDVLVVEPSWKKAGESTLRGRLRMYSGATWGLLWTREGPEPTSGLGSRYGAAGDVDGDGYADVMATATLAGIGGAVQVFSGLDGSLLDTIDLSADTSSPLGALVAAGRQDAGACDDMLVGITNIDGNGGARLYASSEGGVHGFTDLGFAKPTGAGELPTLHGYGDLAAGSLVTVKARHLPPNTTGTWFLGISAGYLPFKQGVLVPNPAGPFFLFAVATDANGTFSITAPNPAGPISGLTIYHQMWFVAPGATANLAATNGLGETFK